MTRVDPPSMEESAGRERVAALTAQVRRDLARIAHPCMSWLEPRLAADGKPGPLSRKLREAYFAHATAAA